jgi:integrase
MSSLLPVRVHHARTTQATERDTTPLSVRTARLDPKPNRSGYWQIVYTRREPGTGEYRSVPLSTRTRDPVQAAEALARFKASELQAGSGETAAPPKCVQPLLTLYLDALEKEHPLRRLAQERALVWPRRLLGDMRPEDIDQDAINDYVSRRQAGARPVQNSSLRRELTALKSALDWVHKKHKKALPQKAMQALDLPRHGAPRNLWLDEATEARVFQAASDLFLKPEANTYGQSRRALGLFLTMALATAARREAILTLTWERVDMSAGMIDFRDPKRPVTRKRRVMLPIADRLMPVLEQAHREACARWDDGVARGRLFKYGLEGARSAMSRFARDQGVPWLTPHVCRHTWATLAARRGEDLYAIAGVLGDTLATVTANYLHHCPDHLRGAINGRAKP